MATELKLPDVGDNIEKGTVVTVLVNPGDTVTEGQPIIELETDKAVVEVPASAAGTVESVSVKVGDSIQVGGVIATLGGGAPAQAQADAPASPAGGGGDKAATIESTPDSGSAAKADQVAQSQQESQKEQAQAPAASAPTSAPSGGASAGGSQQVVLPDVGDNIEKGTVVTVLVNVGDSVSEGQPIVELETDKAVVEVPSSASGTVQSIDMKVGDSVKVGGALITLSGGAAPAAERSCRPLPPIALRTQRGRLRTKRGGGSSSDAGRVPA